MKTILTIVVLICLSACVKKDGLNGFADKIELSELGVFTDSISLKWSKLNNMAFQYYAVFRKDNQNSPGVVIAQLNDQNNTSYTDRGLPLSSHLEYFVVGYLKNGDTISSNTRVSQSAFLTLKLNTPEFTQDSIKLQWSKITSKQFVSYSVIRKTYINDPGASIATITNSNETSFIDETFPLTDYLSYQIIANFQQEGKISSDVHLINVPQPTITLNPLVTNGDTVTLTFSGINKNHLHNYAIKRKTFNSDMNIGWVDKSSERKFTDNSAPYLPVVEYYVDAQMVNGTKVTSNIQSYKRPDIAFFNLFAYDYRFDSQTEYLYFFENGGNISTFDIQQNKFVTKIQTNAGITLADFGTYNNVRELYVPRTDGWIFIYNARTLENIDQINVGWPINSVISSSDILYAATTDPAKPLKVISRKDKIVKSEMGLRVMSKLKKIPGTSTQFIAIGNSNPIYTELWKFDASGNHLDHGTSTFSDIPFIINPGIMELFPDGKRYVVSGHGLVFNTSMQYIANLPKGTLSLSCFAFDGISNEIYAGTSSKIVEVYSMTGYNNLRTINARDYPRYIFKNGNKLVVVETNTIEYF